MYSCLDQSPWPRESNAPNSQDWVTCPFLMQLRPGDWMWREWFPCRKLRYQEKGAWAPNGENNNIHHRCELGDRYDLEHQLCSGRNRSCGFWNPGGCQEMPQILAQLLNQYGVLGLALYPPWVRFGKSVVLVWGLSILQICTLVPTSPQTFRCGQASVSLSV